MKSNDTSANLLLRAGSDYEPYGSQQYQYHGRFVSELPVGMHERNVDRLVTQPNGNSENAVSESDNSSWIPYYDFFVGLITKFDKPFVILLGVQNINHGLWSIAVLACQDLFKQYMHMNPGDMTKYMSLIHIPWSIKLLYGLMSDNVPIAGTRRKSYVVIMGVL